MFSVVYIGLKPLEFEMNGLGQGCLPRSNLKQGTN